MRKKEKEKIKKRKCGNCTRLKKIIAEMEKDIEIMGRIETEKAMARCREAERLAEK
jgi:hypothetical protein